MRLRQKNNTPVVLRYVSGAMIVSGLLLFATLILSCSPEPVVYSADDALALHRWLDENRRTPADILDEELVTGRSAILVQDEKLRADTIDLMRSLTPVLYDLGIRDVGVFFLNASKQDELDGYIVGGDGITLPGKLLLSADAALGYREYCDYMEYVRNFNQMLPPGLDPIRLLALAENGITSKTKLTEVLGSDETSAVRQVFLWILAEDLDLIQVSPATGDGDGDGDEDTVSVPLIITHHGPGIERLRWGGLIESVAAERDIRDRTYAFKTEEAPFPGFTSEEAGMATDMYLVTPFAYRAVTPIPDFITPESAIDALAFFPDISMEKPISLLAARMNRKIRRAAQKYDAGVEKLGLNTGY
jgi:hypothetical protein